MKKKIVLQALVLVSLVSVSACEGIKAAGRAAGGVLIDQASNEAKRRGGIEVNNAINQLVDSSAAGDLSCEKLERGAEIALEELNNTLSEAGSEKSYDNLAEALQDVADEVRDAGDSETADSLEESASDLEQAQAECEKDENEEEEAAAAFAEN